MPVCTQKMKKQWVLCSHIILQYKTCQINLTANKLSKNNYPNMLHTYKDYVTIIDFLARPGPNVPYVGRSPLFSEREEKERKEYFLLFPFQGEGGSL